MRFHVQYLPNGDVEERATIEVAARSAQLDPTGLRYHGNGVWNLPKESPEHLEKLDPITSSVIGHANKRPILFEDAYQWLEFVQLEHE